MSIFLIDDKEIDWRDVIKMAREYGYDSDSGIYQTSIACEYLRKNGHKVEGK